MLRRSSFVLALCLSLTVAAFADQAALLQQNAKKNAQAALLQQNAKKSAQANLLQQQKKSSQQALLQQQKGSDNQAALLQQQTKKNFAQQQLQQQAKTTAANNSRPTPPRPVPVANGSRFNNESSPPNGGAIDGALLESSGNVPYGDPAAPVPVR